MRPIVTTTDDNYVLPLLVMVKSAIENAELTNFDLIIVHDQDRLSDKNKKLITSVLSDQLSSIKFYVSKKYESFKNIFNDQYSSKSKIFNKNWSSSVLLHGFISDAIPDTIDEIIFIETDLFFVRKADGFINFELILPIAAQLDYGSGTQNYYDTNPYFNAGVFITSLKYWRSNNAPEYFINSLLENKYDKFGIWPQDFLNDFFKDKWHLLGTQINVARECLALEKIIRYSENIVEQQNFTFHDHPILVHFLGYPKPFHPDYWDDSTYRWRIQNNYIDLDYQYLEMLNKIKAITEENKHV